MQACPAGRIGVAGNGGAEGAGAEGAGGGARAQGRHRAGGRRDDERGAGAAALWRARALRRDGETRVLRRYGHVTRSTHRILHAHYTAPKLDDVRR